MHIFWEKCILGWTRTKITLIVYTIFNYIIQIFSESPELYCKFQQIDKFAKWFKNSQFLNFQKFHNFAKKNFSKYQIFQKSHNFLKKSQFSNNKTTIKNYKIS